MDTNLKEPMALACLPDYEPEFAVTFSMPAGQCFLVIDKMVLGRCWGGLRVAEDVTLDEVRILARTMTVKSLLAGVPIGGAKAGVCITNKNYSRQELLYSISKVLEPWMKKDTYFLGTDIGFKEEDVDTLYSLAGSKRRFFSGVISVGQACAYGILSCIRYLWNNFDIDIEGAKVALEGFGRLGSATAKLLSSNGFRIVAVSNIHGTLYDPKGLCIEEMIESSKGEPHRMISDYSIKHLSATVHPREAINLLDCDILIPGARTFTIDHLVAEKVKARIVCPLSNVPVTLLGEKILAKGCVVSVPDVISNSGALIASVAQHLGADTTQTYNLISKIIAQNLELVYSQLNPGDVPKHVACKIASERFADLDTQGMTGFLKLLVPWIKSLGPGALWNAAREYYSLGKE